MIGSLRAELLKLRQRPAVWILGAILVSGIILFGYALSYPATVSGSRDPRTQALVEAQRRRFLPRYLLPTVLPLIAGMGGPVALILGGPTTGSEYEWGTLKTILAQRPGRLSLFSGKVLALGGVLLWLVFLAFAAGGLSSTAIAHYEGLAITYPPLTDVAKGVGIAWLILAAWCAFGLALAVLMRGTALALGLGLVYAVVLEGLIGSLATQVVAAKIVRKGLLAANTDALASSFPSPVQAVLPHERFVGTTHATLVVVLYGVGFLVVAAVLFRRCDVA